MGAKEQAELVKKTVARVRVVPVIKLEDPEQAVPLGEALTRAGLPIAEVTFRTAAAADGIRAMRAACPGVVVCAGSLATREQALEAYVAGAMFFVSAGFSPKIADVADEKEIPYYAGCCTPTEILMAVDRGYDVVKFFPAKPMGGVETIKMLSGPFPGLKFMPTGGINAGNLKESLSCDKVLACGGSWMVNPKLMAEGHWDEIERLSREAVSLAREA